MNTKSLKKPKIQDFTYIPKYVYFKEFKQLFKKMPKKV